MIIKIIMIIIIIIKIRFIEIQKYICIYVIKHKSEFNYIIAKKIAKYFYSILNEWFWSLA